MDAQAVTLFSAIANAGKVVFDIAQSTTKISERQRLMDVYDELMGLKRSAADLEDENRALKEKLRFRSEDFDFKTPFWYEKKNPERPLCAKCHAKENASPMGEPYETDSGSFRKCLVCDNQEKVGPRRISGDFDPRLSGPNSWMR